MGLRAFLLTLLLGLTGLNLPGAARAQCQGRDLLPDMAPDARAALQARAEKVPYGTGLLWRATRSEADGARTVLTIFGSYHLHHARTQAHFELLRPIGEAADVAWFEMNATDMATFEREAAQNPAVLFRNEGPTLPEQLSEADWQLVREKMAARGFPGFLTAKMKPIFVSMMLGLSPCQMRAMQDPDKKGIDDVLARHFEGAGKDTRSLEHYLTALSVMDGVSHKDQIDMLRLSLYLPQDPDDILETMYRAYLREEIAVFWEYGRYLSLAHGGDGVEEDFAQLEDLLLSRRNRAWVDLLLRDAVGGTHFLTFGAAHLIGENGVLALLRGAGFTIERMPLGT